MKTPPKDPSLVDRSQGTSISSAITRTRVEGEGHNQNGAPVFVSLQLSSFRLLPSLSHLNLHLCGDQTDRARVRYSESPWRMHRDDDDDDMDGGGEIRER